MATIFISITFIISIMFMFLASNLAKVSYANLDKSSPFECGFNPMFKTRIPFSLQFFLIALIFIIFDMEIILILPIPLIALNSWKTTLSAIILMMILIIGLFHEWNQGSLNWM